MHFIPKSGMHGVNSWIIPILVWISHFHFNNVYLDYKAKKVIRVVMDFR